MLTVRSCSRNIITVFSSTIEVICYQESRTALVSSLHLYVWYEWSYCTQFEYSQLQIIQVFLLKMLELQGSEPQLSRCFWWTVCDGCFCSGARRTSNTIIVSEVYTIDENTWLLLVLGREIIHFSIMSCTCAQLFLILGDTPLLGTRWYPARCCGNVLNKISRYNVKVGTPKWFQDNILCKQHYRWKHDNFVERKPF
jgi:hypothetical protein